MKGVKCIVCKSQLREDHIVKKYAPIQSRSWSPGTVDCIIPGYGSCKDGSHLIVAICDTCIKVGLKSGTIKELSQKAISKNKKWYNEMKEAYERSR